MSTLKVAAIKDLSNSGGFTLSSGAITANGTLTVSNIIIDGAVTGNSKQYLPNQSGQAGKVLSTDGTSPFWATAPATDNITSMQTFTGGGTWTRPTGVRFIKVQVQGGGGGGSGHGESGGAGGYSERVLDVSSISSVSVTISGESNGTYYSGAGDNGGTSSFGSYCSASGGYGANRNNQHSGGLAGVGSGGNLNIYGGGGQSHHNYSSVGGSSFFGGAAAAGHPQGGNFSHNHQSHSAQGSGGSGGYFNSHRGSNGRPGMVVVTHYK
jgi:hypothetical protein